MKFHLRGMMNNGWRREVGDEKLLFVCDKGGGYGVVIFNGG